MVGEPPNRDNEWADMLWYSYLTGDHSQLDSKVKVIRRIFKRLPSEPRCRVCNAPFHGLGKPFASLLGFGAGRSRFNPSLCDRCEKIVTDHEVGLEVELTMLFADVRGSTKMAEEIGASEFHQLINRFYKASAEVLVQTDALIDRLIGDEMIGLYVPGIAGPEYTQKAVQAARALLEATGHAEPDGAWIQVGAAVHTGSAYVGSVGSSKSVSDITVLGDVANTAARLASQAGPGEILVSEDACRLVNLNLENYDQLPLQLKGRSEPISVRKMQIKP